MTNGIVVVIENGRIVLKVIAGCDGYNDKGVAEFILLRRMTDPEWVSSLASSEGFGCVDCRVTLYRKRDKVKVLYADPMNESNQDGFWTRWIETFDQICVNPRFDPPVPWTVTVVNLDTNQIERKSPDGK